MFTKLLTVAIMLFGSVSALAQHGVGNGGVGLECPDSDTPNEVIVLDALYGELAWGVRIDLGPPGLSWIEKVKLAIRRIPDEDLPRRRNYMKALENFVTRSVYVSARRLNQTPDFRMHTPRLPDLIEGRGCRPVQLANLIYEAGRDDFTCFINKDAFIELTNDQRALLFLHEIVYREWKRAGEDHLEPVYRVVSLLASGDLEQMPAEKYREILSEAGFLVLWQR